MNNGEIPVGEGYLQVRVTGARGAFPIEGANVFIYSDGMGESGELISSQETDSSGLTVPITVSVPGSAISQSPGAVKPYGTVNIQVLKDGYYPVESSGAPIFDGIKSVQTIDLISRNVFAKPGEFPKEGLKIQEAPGYSALNGGSNE